MTRGRWRVQSGCGHPDTEGSVQYQQQGCVVSVVVSEMAINAITSTLKLYFREWPKPLFTDKFTSP